MKITICYADGDCNDTGKCRVFGFSDSFNGKMKVHAELDFPEIPGLANMLIDSLNKMGSDYHDVALSGTVPQSANIVTGIVECILSREEHQGVPYRAVIRDMERPGLFVKWERSTLTSDAILWA